MARAKSIGSLFVDIEARTAKLEQDMGRVKNVLKQGRSEIAGQGEEWAKLSKANEKFANQLASRLAGAISLFSLMKREITFVSQNIDRIPGLPPTVVASVKEMNQNLSEFRGNIHGVTAGLMAKFADFGKALGMSLGALGGPAEGPSGADDPSNHGFFGGKGHMERINAYKEEGKTLDEIAQLEDIAYGDKVRAKMLQLSEARKEAARASMSEVDQIKQLRVESQAWEKFSQSNSFNTLERTQAKIEALKRSESANQKFQTMQEQLIEQEKRVAASMEQGAIATLSVADTVSAYTTKVWTLRHALVGINDAIKNAPLDPALLKQKIDKTKELADAQEKLNAALKKQGELGMKVGQSIADNLGDAIMRGEGLHEMLNQIFRDILRIVLQRSVIEPLGGFLGGVFGNIFKFGSGKAAGGPIGPGMRWVGENGPEILATGGYGTIIPNNQIRGGSSGNTYILNIPPGASDETVRRIESTLQQLAGPGVVERRAVGAVINAKWRRGGAGANL